MTEHIHPETLALVALDEPVEASARTHIDECAVCRAEVEALQRIRHHARELDDDDREPPPPPERVWDAIARELEAGAEAAEGAAPASGATDETAPPGSIAGDAEVTALPADRVRRSRVAAALAVAASLVVGVVIGTTLWDPQPEPGAVVADAELEALAEVPPGTARLVRIDDAVHLEVEAPELPAPDGYYALWMIDLDVAGMVSLGPLEPGRTYPLPEGLDPAAYPVVDVSIEPLDGDPTHSGNSVLRGVLPLES